MRIRLNVRELREERGDKKELPLTKHEKKEYQNSLHEERREAKRNGLSTETVLQFKIQAVLQSKLAAIRYWNPDPSIKRGLLCSGENYWLVCHIQRDKAAKNACIHIRNEVDELH